MTSTSKGQQEFREKLVSFGLSTMNINRIINQSITEALELVTIDNGTIFTDGVMSTGTSGITAGQKMKIKALLNWCRHEYMLQKRAKTSHYSMKTSHHIGVTK